MGQSFGNRAARPFPQAAHVGVGDRMVTPLLESISAATSFVQPDRKGERTLLSSPLDLAGRAGYQNNVKASLILFFLSSLPPSLPPFLPSFPPSCSPGMLYFNYFGSEWGKMNQGFQNTLKQYRNPGDKAILPNIKAALFCPAPSFLRPHLFCCVCSLETL